MFFLHSLIYLREHVLFSMCRSVIGCQVLLCAWHVRRAWLKNVFKLASCEDVGRNMFSTLGAIMNGCRDPNSVAEALDQFYEEFRNENRFLQYFSRNWMDNQKFRKNLLNLFKLLQNKLLIEYCKFNTFFLQRRGKKVIKTLVMPTKKQTAPLKDIIVF